MSESSEQAGWEEGLTRRDVLLKGVAAGGALAVGSSPRTAICKTSIRSRRARTR